MGTVERSSNSIPVQIDLGDGTSSGQSGRLGDDVSAAETRTIRLHTARAQLEHLFPPVSFPMRLAYGEVPPGWREIEVWRVIPSRRSPRFLVPVEPSAAARLVLSHNGLRTRREAATRRLAALAMRPLALSTGRHNLLRLSAPADVSDHDIDDAVITRHLRRRLPEATSTAISLRAFHPRAKPTVQLLDDRGRVVAFAKVASDPATGERVLTEADLMETLGADLDTEDSPIRLPRVLDTGRCGPFAYSVVEPLPVDARRVGDDDEPLVLRALATFGGGPSVPSRMPLAQTALWDEVMARSLAARTARSAAQELVTALARLTATAHRTDAALLVPVGRYHGDWTPWNMGESKGVIWAWDLEYGSPQGPLGLDALRWTFQIHHAMNGSTFTEGVAAMTAAAPRVLPPLGVPLTLTTPLVRFHVIETVSTALGLLASGRGLPSGLDDAIEVMRSLEAPHVPPAQRRP
ncbi:MAG: hypothetical protein JNL54_07730 [Kineosporiaceae bacterium]|nr:hypothetical protein [Kineosporiaceae bacterium]